jgi:hypothetical protein
MTLELRLGIAVAVKTKAVKSCLYSDLEIRADTAMTVDAAVEAAAIGIVMVADKTVDGRMFAVIEIQRQRLTARQQGFTERDARAARDERAEREHRGRDDADDEG